MSDDRVDIIVKIPKDVAAEMAQYQKQIDWGEVIKESIFQKLSELNPNSQPETSEQLQQTTAPDTDDETRIQRIINEIKNCEGYSNAIFGAFPEFEREFRGHRYHYTEGPLKNVFEKLGEGPTGPGTTFKKTEWLAGFYLTKAFPAPQGHAFIYYLRLNINDYQCANNPKIELRGGEHTDYALLFLREKLDDINFMLAKRPNFMIEIFETKFENYNRSGENQITITKIINREPQDFKTHDI